MNCDPKYVDLLNYRTYANITITVKRPLSTATIVHHACEEQQKTWINKTSKLKSIAPEQLDLWYHMLPLPHNYTWQKVCMHHNRYRNNFVCDFHLGDALW